VHQLVGVMVGERRDAEAHVAQQLDVDAAEPKPISGPNRRSAATPIIVSTPPAQHRLDQHAVDGVEHAGLLGAREDVVERAPDGGFVLQVQAHAADLGLVLHLGESTFATTGNPSTAPSAAASSAV
jgi:hypothetical protein